MATSDSLLDIRDGRVRVVFHSDASKLSVAVRAPVTARLFYDTGGWATLGNPWNLIVNGQPSGVIEHNDDDRRSILNVSLDSRLAAGQNTLEIIGAVWPNSRGGLLLLSEGTSIVINVDYTWSGGATHNIINQTWTLDYTPE